MLEFEAAKRGKTLVLGHRGAAGHAPENTMISFQKGLECGADLIELDVHVSIDGELVVMHDAEVARTTNGRGNIEDMTLAEIKRLDAGAKFDPKFSGERIPTLSEVLDWARGRVPLVVELKGNPFPTRGVEEKLVGLFRRFQAVEDTMVISFYHAAMRRIKDLEPGLATGLLYVGQLVDAPGAARAARSDSLRPGWQYWTSELVSESRAAGLIASTWNTNDRATMDRLVPMGFASIGSDFPDRLRAYIDQTDRSWRTT